MAKETTVIFLYDTELLKREEDDPNSAILYFYPTWASDQQKTALCGQLMGTVRCLKSIFSMPKTLSLQTGKFYFIENDRYILVIGSDRNIPDWVLERRANLFYSLVNFFHKDFTNLALLYQKDALNAKLYHMFDTYLKLMLFGGNIFSHIPMLEIPKSGSTVLMETVAFLDRCREFPNALGGTILYHNKVVATHLSASTTKKIVFADPYRIKNPAEVMGTDFELPFGAQLLQVYITNKEFCSLLESSIRCRCILQHWISKKIKKERTPETDTPLKRDSSLLFTVVPEEDPPTLTNQPLEEASEQCITYRQNVQKRSRPNSLNLKSHNFDLNETKLNTKTTPGSLHGSQSSIANTPLAEVKMFVHQHSLDAMHKRNSMIEDPGGTVLEQQEENKETNNLESSSDTKIANFSDSCQKPNPISNLKEPNSLVLLSESRTNVLPVKKPLNVRTSLVDLSNSILNKPDQYSNSVTQPVCSPKTSRTYRRRTIHDPLNAFFREDGLAVSQYYFQKLLNGEVTCPRERIVTKVSAKEFRETSRNLKFIKDKVYSEPRQHTCHKANKDRRKSLTLPLKPLNSSESNRADRKYSLGVQLTPLMNKLTLLAYEEHTKANRISQIRHPFGLTPSKESMDSNFRKKEDRRLGLEEDNELRGCVLFVCGQKDVVLALLLQEGCAKDQETIDKLWELCTEHLPKFEKQINYLQTAQNTKSSPHDAETYSFLNVHQDWDTVKREGPWDDFDLKDVTSMYGDFKENEEMSEIFLRNPESVLYGHRLGSSQIYYQEAAPVTSSILQPNDVVGSVKQKASRRLDRDHNIVLS